MSKITIHETTVALEEMLKNKCVFWFECEVGTFHHSLRIRKMSANGNMYILKTIIGGDKFHCEFSTKHHDLQHLILNNAQVFLSLLKFNLKPYQFLHNTRIIFENNKLLRMETP